MYESMISLGVKSARIQDNQDDLFSKVSGLTLFQMPSMYNGGFMDFGTKWASITGAVMLVFHMNSDIGCGCKNTKTGTTTIGPPIQFLKIGTNSGFRICNKQFKDV